MFVMKIEAPLSKGDIELKYSEDPHFEVDNFRTFDEAIYDELFTLVKKSEAAH